MLPDGSTHGVEPQFPPLGLKPSVGMTMHRSSAVAEAADDNAQILRSGEGAGPDDKAEVSPLGLKASVGMTVLQVGVLQVGAVAIFVRAATFVSAGSL